MCKQGNGRIDGVGGDNNSNIFSSDEVDMSLSSFRFTCSGTVLTSSEEINVDF